jgi:hypothetical protein
MKKAAGSEPKQTNKQTVVEQGTGGGRRRASAASAVLARDQRIRKKKHP